MAVIDGEFESQLKLIRSIYEEKIPFNELLGFKVEQLKLGFSAVRFDMRDQLVGNWIHGILHGGVISAVLDATGGMTATTGLLEKMQDQSIEQIQQRITKIGTIDLRVDYLRPGRGKYFRATSRIMRTGNKVAVTRMELHNHKDLLIAVGTGTYIIG